MEYTIPADVMACTYAVSLVSVEIATINMRTIITQSM